MGLGIRVGMEWDNGKLVDRMDLFYKWIVVKIYNCIKLQVEINLTSYFKIKKQNI